MAPFVRPFLAVARTTLADSATGEQYPFSGLFTTVSLPRGAFLGFYNGNIKDGSYRGPDRYCIGGSSVHVRPKRKNGQVDGARYPLAMANEPPTGAAANAAMVEFSRAAGTIPSLPSRTEIAAIGFYTCAPVPAGAEIFVHYGRAYDRSHYPNPFGLPPHELVGEFTRPPLVREREKPVDMMQLYGLHYVDPECYSEME